MNYIPISPFIYVSSEEDYCVLTFQNEKGKNLLTIFSPIDFDEEELFEICSSVFIHIEKRNIEIEDIVGLLKRSSTKSTNDKSKGK